MALPAAWKLVRVFGRYRRLDGLPNNGSVTLTSRTEVYVNDDDGQRILVVPKVLSATLDANGAFELMVPTTDDPDISPVGWAYDVVESMPGGTRYAIVVPVAMDEINLVTWARVDPVPVPPPGKSYLTTDDIGVNVASQSSVNQLRGRVDSAEATASQAITTAGTALTTAQAAKTESAQATVTANAASDKADMANNTAGNANLTAQQAVSTANGAVTTANAASATAGEAKTAANNAVTTASDASSKADGAVTTANAAAAKADSATTAANTATNTANDAKAASTAATNTANSALSTANDAQSQASTAVSTANDAKGQATIAVNQASAAVNTANQANATANGKQDKSNTLTAISQTSLLQDTLIFGSGTDQASVTPLTGQARLLLGKTTAADQRVVLGLGTAATANVGTTPGSVAAGDDPRFGTLGNPTQSLKNKIINGDFQVWQYGTSGPITGARFMADRWRTNFSTATSPKTTVQFTRVAYPTDAPNNNPDEPMPAYGLELSIVVNSTTPTDPNERMYIAQRIEDVRTSGNQTITLSFKALSTGSTPMSVAIEFVQYFGQGRPSPDVDGTNGIPTTKFQLTNNLKKYTYVVPMPSVVGKTVADYSFYELRFWLSAGATWAPHANNLGQQSGTIRLFDVQVEYGGIATQFDRRPFASELLLCQRYYCKSFEPDTTPAAFVNIGQGATSHSAVAILNDTVRTSSVPFPTAMLGVPLMTFYGTNAATTSTPGIWSAVINGGFVDATPSAQVSRTAFMVTLSLPGAVPPGAYNLQGHWTASAEL